jgi:hypothetical protein
VQSLRFRRLDVPQDAAAEPFPQDVQQFHQFSVAGLVHPDAVADLVRPDFLANLVHPDYVADLIYLDSGAYFTWTLPRA